MRTLILISAILLASSLSHPVFADDTNDTTENSQTEGQGSSDFDNWYKPDDTYPTNDQKTTENDDKSSGPDEGPFLAPDEDQRSKLR